MDGASWGYTTPDFKNFQQVIFEFLTGIWSSWSNSFSMLFLWETGSIGARRLLISTCQSPKVAGGVVDVRVRQPMQLFHHASHGIDFSQYCWKEESATPLASPCQHWKQRRVTHFSTNKKQGQGEKQIMIGPRAGRRYRSAEGGN